MLLVWGAVLMVVATIIIVTLWSEDVIGLFPLMSIFQDVSH